MSQEPALYLVPTPIGNLDDITFRAIRVLKEVDLILAEDTRTSGKLLKHFEISTPMRSFHAFNEHKVLESIAEEIQSGKAIALISDAGTPGISDPGFLLVRECANQKIRVECLPGATAMIPAVVKSGIPCDRFIFEGFLPHKKGRMKRIEALSEEPRTIIFYESPHRLKKLLEQLISVMGEDRQVSVTRELTKMYEETVNDTLSAALNHFEKKDPKGEFVVVLAGKTD